MSTFGIVGAGIAGLHLALHLQKEGIDATLYSDRDADEIGEGRLPNTVALHGATRARDAALGTNHWDAPEHSTYGIAMRVEGQPPLEFVANMKQPSLFIDMRVYVPRLMADFRARGGKVVIAKTGPEEVARLAERHDLMIVAAGRAGLTDMFPRLAERSPYQEPQRRLFCGLFHGVQPSSPARMGFNIVPGRGEILEFHYVSHGGFTTGVGIEAIPGGPFDHVTRLRYEDDPAAFNAAVLAILREHAPDTYARIDPATFGLTRGLDTLSGGFTPTARRGWAPLGGGHMAMAIGDTHITHDPLTGQGANAASREAWSLAEILVAHARAGGRFDETFCARTEQHLWDDARPVTEWSNAFLQPPPPHVMGLLIAAAQDPAIANAFADNFNNPKQQWAVLSSPEATAAFIASFSVGPASVSAPASRVGRRHTSMRPPARMVSSFPMAISTAPSIPPPPSTRAPLSSRGAPPSSRAAGAYPGR
jgi:2-polyprenyl-6-methoxyphenol hydroxylase-like FAD-dependent oxidoreductase